MSRNPFLLFWPAVLLILATLHAQEAPGTPVRVDSIAVEGNIKTRPAVILREVHLSPPCEVTVEDLQEIQNRLSNLYIFNRVQVGVLEKDDRNVMVIQVTETHYLYPLPIIFLNDREWDRISYGFQVSHYNFRGQNEKLYLGGWLGFNPSFFLNYSNPWIGGQSRFIFGLGLFVKRTRSRFADEDGRSFDTPQTGGQLTLGKRLTLYTSLQAAASLRRVDFPERSESLSASGSKRDIYPRFDLTLRTDHRDLREYPHKGYYLRWAIIRGGLGEEQADFWRYELDNRAYLPLHKRLTFAARNLLKFNRGAQPSYDYTFIGYSERIRGYFDRRFPAQNLMLQNLEMRISLLPVRYFSWDEAPQMSALFRDMKFGVSMGLFLDTGAVWKDLAQLDTRDYFSGYGVGLHLHLPHIHLLRIDHAWSDQGDREWIIEGGVSF